MILAYNTLSDPIHIALFSEEENKIDEITQKNDSRSRIDLLKEIWKILQKNSVSPTDISRLVVCNGPGNFTPVRTACIIANAFATQNNADIYVFSSPKSPVSLQDILRTKQYSKEKEAIPVFCAAPRIHIAA